MIWKVGEIIKEREREKEKEKHDKQSITEQVKCKLDFKINYSFQFCASGKKKVKITLKLGKTAWKTMDVSRTYDRWLCDVMYSKNVTFFDTFSTWFGPEHHHLPLLTQALFMSFTSHKMKSSIFSDFLNKPVKINKANTQDHRWHSVVFQNPMINLHISVRAAESGKNVEIKKIQFYSPWKWFFLFVGGSDRLSKENNTSQLSIQLTHSTWSIT